MAAKWARARRIIGVHSPITTLAQWVAGWQIRTTPNDPKPNLWVIDSVGTLATNKLTAAGQLTAAQYVCVGPVEKIGRRRDGGDNYGAVDWGLLMALRESRAAGIGVGFERSDEARASGIDLLIDSRRLAFIDDAAHLHLLRTERSGQDLLAYAAVAAFVFADPVGAVAAADARVWDLAKIDNNDPYWRTQ